MQRTDALKWFWPFMIVAALAAATIIALPQFAASHAAATEPQFRMQLTVRALDAHVADAKAVTIEPGCIEVRAKRPASIVDRWAGLLKRWT